MSSTRPDPVIRTVPLLLLLAVAATPIRAQSTTEDFEDLQNEYSWAIGSDPGSQVIEGVGGSPGAYLREAFDFFAPQIRIGSVGAPPPFQGDYGARGVSALSFDAIALAGPAATGRPMSLLLSFGLGTPDPDDDLYAIFVSGEDIPSAGGGWAHYTFAIPTLGDSLPAGWQLIDPTVSMPAWSELMENVTGVNFFFGNPLEYYPTESWDIGVDNLKIHEGSAGFSRGDCNGDEVTDISDAILALAGLFVPGSPPPPCEKACDVNDDGALDIADPIQILSSLFVSAMPVPPPASCGVDPTDDPLTCILGCP